MFIIMNSSYITITTLFMASNGNAVLQFHASDFFSIFNNNNFSCSLFNSSTKFQNPEVEGEFFYFFS